MQQRAYHLRRLGDLCDETLNQMTDNITVQRIFGIADLCRKVREPIAGQIEDIAAELIQLSKLLESQTCLS